MPAPPAARVPLSPLQRWFLEPVAGRPERRSLALVVEARRELDPGRLRRALQAVAAYHPALRLRVDRDGAGGWLAEVAPERPPGFRAVDLRSVPAGRRPAAVAAIAEAERLGLDVRAGPNLRAVLLDRPGGSGVLLVAHHLVLDDYSWWLLLDELEAAYDDPLAHEASRGWAEDGAYLRWARRFEEYAGSRAARDGVRHWLSWPPVALSPAPLDLPGGERTEAAAAFAWATLSADETAGLLAALRREPDLDLATALVTALHAAWSGWTGRSAMGLWLVHHGRVGPLADESTARMIGCAVHSYPAMVDVPACGGDLVARALEVGRQLAAVPNAGVDHGILRYMGAPAVRARMASVPEPDLLLNFVGSLSRELDGSLFARVDPALSGHRRDSGARRELAFDIDARLDDGALRARWTYRRTTHRRATATRLAGAFRRALLTLSRQLSRR